MGAGIWGLSIGGGVVLRDAVSCCPPRILDSSRKISQSYVKDTHSGEALFSTPFTVNYRVIQQNLHKKEKKGRYLIGFVSVLSGDPFKCFDKAVMSHKNVTCPSTI